MTVRDGWRWSLGKFVVPEDLRRLVEDDAVGLFQAEDLGIRHVPAGSVVRGVEHLEHRALECRRCDVADRGGQVESAIGIAEEDALHERRKFSAGAGVQRFLARSPWPRREQPRPRRAASAQPERLCAGAQKRSIYVYPDVPPPCHSRCACASRLADVVYTLYIMKRTQIYLDERQAEALRRRGAVRGATASKLIREAIDQYLAGPDDAAERLGRYRVALDASFGIAPHLPGGARYVDELRNAERARQRELEQRARE